MSCEVPNEKKKKLGFFRSILGIKREGKHNSYNGEVSNQKEETLMEIDNIELSVPNSEKRKSMKRTSSWFSPKEKKKSSNAEDEPKLSSFDASIINDEKPPIHVTCYDELPKNLQKVLKQSKISKEEADANFIIIIHVLHYLYKVNFTQIELEDKEEINFTSVPPPKTTSCRPILDINLLLNEGNPKEIFKIINEEGKGGFGTVHRAYYRGDEKNSVAIKIMNSTSEKERKYHTAEISYLKFCNTPKPHPNIVKYIDCFKNGNELWLIMEYMEGGTLYQAIKCFSFSERQIAYLTKEILTGLAFLHSENLVHRDLKSANIMMTIEGGVKLIDFGLCADLSDGFRIGMIGSPYWMAPEMIQRKEYGFKVDIWSLGICLMELGNGHLPHAKNSVKAMFTVGTIGYKEPLEKSKQWSSKFQDIISLCLTMDPKQRSSSEELLKHEFLLDCDNAKTMKQVISGIFVLNAVLPF